jgi:hypothetical protein
MRRLLFGRKNVTPPPCCASRGAPACARAPQKTTAHGAGHGRLRESLPVTHPAMTFDDENILGVFFVIMASSARHGVIITPQPCQTQQQRPRPQA